VTKSNNVIARTIAHVLAEAGISREGWNRHAEDADARDLDDVELSQIGRNKLDALLMSYIDCDETV
jgi:hypothetical protein